LSDRVLTIITKWRSNTMIPWSLIFLWCPIWNCLQDLANESPSIPSKNDWNKFLKYFSASRLHKNVGV
jgi:hypothetical protein